MTLFLAASCGSDKADARTPRAAAVVRPEESFTAIDSPSLQFLPRQEEAPGWRLEEDPIVIPGDRLPAYLGADSGPFKRYEAIDLTVGQYAAKGPQGFATVEIFRFPDFVKSFGAYSMRKQGTVRYLAIENEAFRSKHSVHLWRGPFYVRIFGGGSADAATALEKLASFVSERMPAAPSKPAVFNFLPSDARVPNSERFSAEQGFGQAVLGNSFQASFNIGGDIMEGLIIPASNKAQATQILDAYRTLYVRNGKLLDPIPNLGEDNFTGEDRYLGRAVAFRLDRFVIAFNGFKERQKLVDLAIATDTRILGSIRRQLVTAEKQAQNGGVPPVNRNAPPWQQPAAPPPPTP